MPKLIVVSAPSGAGKTTLCQKLLQEFSDKLTLSISTTTRAPRGSERHGKEYFFVSKEVFEQEIKEGFFAEWANVHDQLYGTSKKTLEMAFQKGLNVLLDIDVQGAKSLKLLFKSECITFFISPPSLEELELRLRNRKTDSEEVIKKRLRNAQEEMLAKPSFDHVIINDDLGRAFLELKRLVAPHL